MSNQIPEWQLKAEMPDAAMTAPAFKKKNGIFWNNSVACFSYIQ
jgi:hypothetical protein